MSPFKKRRDGFAYPPWEVFKITFRDTGCEQHIETYTTKEMLSYEVIGSWLCLSFVDGCKRMIPMDRIWQADFEPAGDK